MSKGQDSPTREGTPSIDAVLLRLSVVETTYRPSATDNITLFDLLGFVGMFAGAILIMRVVLEILNER